MGGRSRHFRRGMTLLEVVLAMGLLAVLTSMTYVFYATSLSTQKRGTEEARKLRLMRVTMDRIAREIRQVRLTDDQGGVGLRGGPERIWLTTLRVPSRETAKELVFEDQQPVGEYDIVKVEYKIARHEELLDDDGFMIPIGLARVEQLTPRPDSLETGEAFEEEELAFEESVEAGFAEEETDEFDAWFDEALEEEEVSEGGRIEIAWEELYSQEIKYIRFCYFDGMTWWDHWDVGGENPLPQAVLVTLGYEGEAPYEDIVSEDRCVEEFCACMSDETIDCEPLRSDRLSRIVRIPLADRFFRSRIDREVQGMMEELGTSLEDAAGEEEALP